MLNHAKLAPLLLSALSLLPLTASAHHSFSAEFDLQKDELLEASQAA